MDQVINELLIIMATKKNISRHMGNQIFAVNKCFQSSVAQFYVKRISLLKLPLRGQGTT